MNETIGAPIMRRIKREMEMKGPVQTCPCVSFPFLVKFFVYLSYLVKLFKYLCQEEGRA
uniref:Uncharacterized protein n=1 Tax=Rhizophora mucronata TaxID=61149 RepID=A0A2P2NCX5_RHIMU